MGRSKALLPWQGLPLILYQIRNLRRAGLRPIHVVLGHNADVIGNLIHSELGATTLLNPFYQRGKTTSLKTGFRALDPKKTDSVLILNVDQPRSKDTISTIIDHHRAKSALITAPTYGDKRGHPVVISLKLIKELLAISESWQGLKAVMRKYASEIRYVEMESEEVLLDLNTPEEYTASFQKYGQA